MPIGTSDGQTYESELDQLFGDMDRAQEAQKGKMKDLESVGPSMVPQPNEDDQLHPQDTKDQNDPKNWGLDRILQELGKQDSAPGTSNTDRQPDETIPVNARLTAAETPAGPSPVGTPLEERTPSPYGKGYDAFIVQLEKASEALNPSFIPSAQQFMEAPWKEKLGFILATSMMLTRGTPGAKPPSLEAADFFKGGIEKLDTAALEHYRKLDTPVARQEYAQMIKDKITAASEGGETAASDITQPTIRGMKEGSDWSEVITKPDGSKETVYSAAKIERLRNLRDNGLSFTEIGEKMGVSRDSVSSMVRRLKRMDAEDVSPPEPKAYNPWTPEQDKELTTWYNNPNSDLFTPPNLLRHRSEGAINARIKQLGLEKAAEEESAKPFVPKGAVSAPEKGSGSGGPVNTDLTGKSGISTPNTVPKNANVNVDPKTLDITTPEMEKAMDKMWSNFGASQEKNIPLISPVTAERLNAINPAAFKKLRQFETEMDYKHKSQDRQWLSELSDADIAKYRKLYEQAQKEPPRDVNDIKYRIRRMLNPPEPDK